MTTDKLLFFCVMLFEMRSYWGLRLILNVRGWVHLCSVCLLGYILCCFCWWFVIWSVFGWNLSDKIRLETVIFWLGFRLVVDTALAMNVFVCHADCCYFLWFRNFANLGFTRKFKCSVFTIWWWSVLCWIDLFVVILTSVDVRKKNCYLLVLRNSVNDHGVGLCVAVRAIHLFWSVILRLDMQTIHYFRRLDTTWFSPKHPLWNDSECVFNFIASIYWWFFILQH